MQWCRTVSGRHSPRLSICCANYLCKNGPGKLLLCGPPSFETFCAGFLRGPPWPEYSWGRKYSFLMIAKIQFNFCENLTKLYNLAVWLKSSFVKNVLRKYVHLHPSPAPVIIRLSTGLAAACVGIIPIDPVPVYPIPTTLKGDSHKNSLGIRKTFFLG